MATFVSLYSASFSQAGSSSPTITVAGGKSTVSATWLRLATGSYQLSSSGLPDFSDISGSFQSGTGSGLYLSFYTSGSTFFTGSIEFFRSGSNTGSLFLRTYGDISSGQTIDKFPGAIILDAGLRYF